jgi:hypothetical protein
MTDGIRRTMQDMTGASCIGCPWHALRDPFVQRVLAAMPFFESGQLAFYATQPSHRLVHGIRYYHSIGNRVFSKQMELDRAQRDRESARQPSTTTRRYG